MGALVGRNWTFLAPLFLAGLSALGLLAALKIPRVAPSRSEGGLVATIRIAWESIKADRVLGLTLLGQVFVLVGCHACAAADHGL